MIKAIQTRYAGCLFRSRTEARWAVFFTSLGVRWEYEREGYDLPSGRYLPDFWLPDLNTWIEVKGQEPTQVESELLAELADATGAKAICAIGAPEADAEQFEWGFVKNWKLALTDGPAPEFPVGEPCLFHGDGGEWVWSKKIWSRNDAHPLGWSALTEDERDEVFHAELERDLRINLVWPPRLKRAYEAARSARFEHGEQPA